MKQVFKTIILASITTFVAFSLIAFPNDSFEASIRGLNIWWEVVFPSLLPFFITSELLIGFGVVRFIGVLFEPIMRPLFNVPGVGSFGWVMGMASGYPTGAKIAARLREEEQITRVEAERLVSFTNASSPLFIIGAVSIGFFHDAKLGVLLAVCHYGSNALVGLCMRFYGRAEEKRNATRHKKTEKKFSIKRAFCEMHEMRISDDRALGQILGDAVINSIKTLVMVGGFIILFSVLTKLFFLIGLSPLIAIIFQFILSIFSIPIDMALPLFSGLFEITIGAQMISQKTATVLSQAVLVSFIMGFNGLSVQAQVASILSGTDIRFKPYFLARFLHGALASILTVVLYIPLYLNKQTFELNDMPVFNQDAENSWVVLMTIMQNIGPVITLLFLALTAVLLYRRSRA
ncbi:sporulation integral membrane protein YlbJ [Oceanobacillus sp. M65]|uniref:Sporulation integral membrane protein YlbJ n=1 Tax=Oceanobacillus jordanicus TaxID=2867266 RepID=A0AAW5B7D5_9BACI|nr:sporulation integral membrane protein YlbJ [Oceanobacillus jordanicus]AVQ98941.1 sporulation integral membrane protein YlbJ [Oceanobacillus iheyensis]MCG3420474.1 sporulation integral membrane protein YlbJ [Oceanobacillus jordanicus]